MHCDLLSTACTNQWMLEMSSLISKETSKQTKPDCHLFQIEGVKQTCSRHGSHYHRNEYDDR